MGEFYDFGVNLQNLLDLWYGTGEHEEDVPNEEEMSIDDSSSEKRYRSTSSVELTESLITSRVEARKAICITGLDWENILYVKNTLASLLPEPVALESFHVKDSSDLVVGSLLVPKVVVVASHMPGKKLIDEDGDMGQIDFLYDELQEIGADILLVYLGLPQSVYSQIRHMIYHPRMIDLVFPNQPILRSLANENALITTVGNSDFTSMQKNVMKEWLTKPVSADHPVFMYASNLNPICNEDSDFWNETEIFSSSWFPQASTSGASESYKSATEEHPLADKKKKKKKKSKLFNSKKKRGYSRYEEANYDEYEDELQMDMYSQSGYTADRFSQLSV